MQQPPAILVIAFLVPWSEGDYRLHLGCDTVRSVRRRPIGSFGCYDMSVAVYWTDLLYPGVSVGHEKGTVCMSIVVS
jgi:hypothetical protein